MDDGIAQRIHRLLNAGSDGEDVRERETTPDVFANLTSNAEEPRNLQRGIEDLEIRPVFSVTRGQRRRDDATAAANDNNISEDGNFARFSESKTSFVQRAANENVQRVSDSRTPLTPHVISTLRSSDGSRTTTQRASANNLERATSSEEQPAAEVSNTPRNLPAINGDSDARLLETHREDRRAARDAQLTTRGSIENSRFAVRDIQRFSDELFARDSGDVAAATQTCFEPTAPGAFSTPIADNEGASMNAFETPLFNGTRNASGQVSVPHSPVNRCKRGSSSFRADQLSQYAAAGRRASSVSSESSATSILPSGCTYRRKRNSRNSLSRTKNTSSERIIEEGTTLTSSSSSSSDELVRRRNVHRRRRRAEANSRSYCADSRGRGDRGMKHAAKEVRKESSPQQRLEKLQIALTIATMRMRLVKIFDQCANSGGVGMNSLRTSIMQDFDELIKPPFSKTHVNKMALLLQRQTNSAFSPEEFIIRVISNAFESGPLSKFIEADTFNAFLQSLRATCLYDYDETFLVSEILTADEEKLKDLASVRTPRHRDSYVKLFGGLGAAVIMRLLNNFLADFASKPKNDENGSNAQRNDSIDDLPLDGGPDLITEAFSRSLQSVEGPGVADEHIHETTSRQPGSSDNSDFVVGEADEFYPGFIEYETETDGAAHAATREISTTPVATNENIDASHPDSDEFNFDDWLRSVSDGYGLERDGAAELHDAGETTR